MQMSSNVTNIIQNVCPSLKNKIYVYTQYAIKQDFQQITLKKIPYILKI
jgi:hypothetical protein